MSRRGMLQVRRGDVVRINFGEVQGAAMAKKRPALVVQNDAGNRNAPHTIVAAIRHDTMKRLPIHVPLRAGTAGLTKDSMVDLGQIATVRLALIGEVTGRLGPLEMARVDGAIRISLSVS